ncbi:MAG: polysaccharide biosynthesis/export family protein [Bacteroidales bacterium]
MPRKGIRILLLFALLVSTFACNRKTQLIYMSNLQNEVLTTIQPQPYRLRPGDMLSVQILTQDPDISRLFNINAIGTAYNTYATEASTYVNGFSVNDSGYIHLPILGRIKVDSLPVLEAQSRIQRETEKYLKDGMAIVKLLNFKVTVIGEVKRPGTYTNYKDNLNIFEAIGLAGDLSDYGERSNVLVLRQTPEGIKSIRINLHDKNILASDGFYLLPNDTVIVEPRQGKVMALNTPNISILLSIITTALLMINIIK